jgi:hypothetical protein
MHLETRSLAMQMHFPLPGTLTFAQTHHHLYASAQPGTYSFLQTDKASVVACKPILHNSDKQNDLSSPAVAAVVLQFSDTVTHNFTHLQAIGRSHNDDSGMRTATTHSPVAAMRLEFRDTLLNIS